MEKRSILDWKCPIQRENVHMKLNIPQRIELVQRTKCIAPIELLCLSIKILSNKPSIGLLTTIVAIKCDGTMTHGDLMDEIVGTSISNRVASPKRAWPRRYRHSWNWKRRQNNSSEVGTTNEQNQSYHASQTGSRRSAAQTGSSSPVRRVGTLRCCRWTRAY